MPKDGQTNPTRIPSKRPMKIWVVTLGIRLACAFGDTIELEVHVHVDQARHQGLPAALHLASDARLIRSSCMRADPFDPVRAEEHALALPHGVSVEDGDVRDVGGLRHHGIMPPEIRSGCP